MLALFRSRTLVLFARNTLAGSAAFAVDMALLWLLVAGGWAYLPAAALAFLVAVTIHYALARAWVFPPSRRSWAGGWALFLANAGIGMVVMLGAFWALTEWTPLHFLVARLLSSVNSGLVVFLLNALYNFRAL